MIIFIIAYYKVKQPPYIKCILNIIHLILQQLSISIIKYCYPLYPLPE